MQTYSIYFNVITVLQFMVMIFIVRSIISEIIIKKNNRKTIYAKIVGAVLYASILIYLHIGREGNIELKERFELSSIQPNSYASKFSKSTFIEVDPVVQTPTQIAETKAMQDAVSNRMEQKRQDRPKQDINNINQEIATSKS